MKKAFTLIEMLVVVAVLVTLMSMVFRLSSIGSDSSRRNETIVRLQRLENCLSGYYAAFGSYPPVKLHGSRDPFLAVGDHGIQGDNRNENLFGWQNIGEQAEVQAWQQVNAACKAQPMACNFPFPEGYSDFIKSMSDTMRQLATSKDPAYPNLWSSDGGSTADPAKTAKYAAGFDDGGVTSGNTGRFSSLSDETDWRSLQVFRYGVMSFLLPRYLVMMGGSEGFFRGDFMQWSDNNSVPSDPFTGSKYASWVDVKNNTESERKGDIAKVANIPSQAVCARWMPNLEGSCNCNYDITLFGINIRSSSGYSMLGVRNADIELFSPDDSGYKDQYILDGVTMLDGWGNDIYYHSPSPYQRYTVWSAGPNGRTFPPWISRAKLDARANVCIGKWTADDILHMSN